jgi:hypothetical protein
MTVFVDEIRIVMPLKTSLTGKVVAPLRAAPNNEETKAATDAAGRRPMSSPPIAEQLLLHERILGGDPVAPPDVFDVFLPYLVEALTKAGCNDEGEACDCAVDAIYDYLDHADRYDRKQARLSTFLLQIARRRLIDRRRKEGASRRRDASFAEVIELRTPPADQDLELRVEIARILPRVASSCSAPPSRSSRTLCASQRRTGRSGLRL